MKNKISLFSSFALALVATLHVTATAAETGVLSTRTDTVNNSQKTNQIGVGLQIGNLSGVTADYWLNNSRAVSGSLTYDGGNTAIAISHLWFARGTFSGQMESLIPYVGAGAIVAFGDRSDVFNRRGESFALGAQIPLGLEWLPVSQRFSIFGELAPSLEVTPIAVGFLTADLGARFYF